jgi:AraC-like DNA-binding protein
VGKQNQDSANAAERMKRYIGDNIREPITAKDVADAAGYSQFHASRLFKEHTGVSPFEYIREQRLIQSALTLRRGGKVIDVALDFVFDSHEGFTRAFTNAFGIAPKRFSSVPKPDGWMIPYRVINRRKIKLEEPKMSEKTAIIFTQIVERPKRKLLLQRSKAAADYFAYCEEFGCADEESGNSIPWEIASGIKEALYEPVGVWLPENMRDPGAGGPDGTGEYAHGVEVPADYSGEVPDGFDAIDLPPCKMLVFQGEPFDDEQYDEAISSLWERIEVFNPVVYGYEYADELAPRMQLAPFGWRGYIEMRPIREIKL